jgi:NAD(P)H-dependent FMN reductase
MRILAFSGSIRKNSYNRKLLGLVVAELPDVTLLDLKEFELPFYDGDLEESQGVPPNGQRLKRLMSEHDLLLVASPEYNGFFTPLLKNTLDWMTRAEAGEQSCQVFKGKKALIISASPGRYGGSRSQEHLRTLLTNIGMEVLAPTVKVGSAHTVFDPPGTVSPELKQEIAALATSIRELPA